MRRIRTRLVVAFLLVALLPAIPLSWVVRNLLSRSFAPAFSSEIESSLSDALAESRDRLRDERQRFASDVEATWIPAIATGLPAPVADGEIALPLPLGEGDEVPAVLRRAAADLSGRDWMPRVGPWIVTFEEIGDARWFFARPLPAGMATRVERIGDTLALLRGFQGERRAVLAGYVLPFVLAYGLLLIVAGAVGALLAGRVAQPVEALAAGARRVGQGDLDTRVTTDATGEVGDLVHAFNGMVESLVHQRGEVARLERVAAWRDLARSLAHEIKNPLTPIQLAVQQLADRYPSEGEKNPEYAELLVECAEIVNEEVEALRRLVREFAEFARLPEPTPVDGELGDPLREIAKLYGERITLDVPHRLPARFDEAELKRALINLVDNGLAACRTAGRTERVQIDAVEDDGGATIRVVDRGTGIRPDHLERIFEPNFSTKSEGMGLGLAIVEGIVRGHGGTIAVESEIGEGTVFTVRLPAADVAPVRKEGA